MNALLLHTNRGLGRFALSMLVPLLLVKAHGTPQGDFEFKIVGTEAVITRYVGAGGAVVIPNTLGGRIVVSIGQEAFSYRTNVTRVLFPTNIITLEDLSFVGCRGLRSVAISDGMTHIGNYAFAFCTSLTNIVVPNSVS